MWSGKNGDISYVGKRRKNDSKQENVNPCKNSLLFRLFKQCNMLINSLDLDSARLG